MTKETSTVAMDIEAINLAFDKLFSDAHLANTKYEKKAIRLIAEFDNANWAFISEEAIHGEGNDK